MRTLYAGTLQIEYSQFYVLADEQQAAGRYGATFDNLLQTFDGQSSGLCGAAVPGLLFFDTSTQYGTVDVRVAVADAEPDLDPSWEDVVEVPYRAGEHTSLVERGDGDAHPLDLVPGSYRLRYAARGRDQVAESGDADDDEAPAEHIEIVLWPALPSPDRVIRMATHSARQMNWQWLTAAALRHHALTAADAELPVANARSAWN